MQAEQLTNKRINKMFEQLLSFDWHKPEYVPD